MAIEIEREYLVQSDVFKAGARPLGRAEKKQLKKLLIGLGCFFVAFALMIAILALVAD